jgi:hypothetical protein
MAASSSLGGISAHRSPCTSYQRTVNRSSTLVTSWGSANEVQVIGTQGAGGERLPGASSPRGAASRTGTSARRPRLGSQALVIGGVLAGAGRAPGDSAAPAAWQLSESQGVRLARQQATSRRCATWSRPLSLCSCTRMEETITAGGAAPSPSEPLAQRLLPGPGSGRMA